MLSEEEINEIDDDERDKIRKNISTMSFEDLQKLKEKLGAKVYNTKILNVKESKKEPRSFKRVNKNRPREMSSKIFVRKKIDNPTISIAKPQKPRDPRFDPLCGTFDKKIFKKNYKFVSDIKRKEKASLEKQLKNTSDPEEKEKIRFLIRRLANQIREEEKQDQNEETKQEEKRQIIEQIRQGQKPILKKKKKKNNDEDDLDTSKKKKRFKRRKMNETPF